MVFLPAVRDQLLARDINFAKQMSQRFSIPEISLEDVFINQKPRELSLSDVDFHPNKKANDLIANKLLENIILHQDYFNIKFTKK